ncbi:MAG: hypothetical protein KDE46_29835, partial [Caldilineaceae bacterium]|nr:hypothetical protein [Caldilineaceae bacterium]
MDLFSSLPPELQQFLIGAASNALGDLSAQLASQLLRQAGRSVRSAFTNERTEALQKATTQAILAAVKDWPVLPPENEVYADLWQRYGAWLLEPVVLGEFRKLLAPTADMTLDYALLQEEFEAAGLAVANWGKPDFEALVQDMVGAFTLAAAEEPLLQEPLKIGVLRQMAESMGALTRLQQQEVRLARRSLGQLERLNAVADSVVDGQTEAVALLRAILVALQDLPQDLSSQQLGYQETVSVLRRADMDDLIGADVVARIGDNAHTVAVGSHITIQSASPELAAAIQQLNVRMAQIAEGLNSRQDTLNTEELADLERNYRQTLVDQFEMLTFRGITPSGK